MSNWTKYTKCWPDNHSYVQLYWGQLSEIFESRRSQWCFWCTICVLFSPNKSEPPPPPINKKRYLVHCEILICDTAWGEIPIQSSEIFRYAICGHLKFRYAILTPLFQGPSNGLLLVAAFLVQSKLAQGLFKTDCKAIWNDQMLVRTIWASTKWK